LPKQTRSVGVPEAVAALLMVIEFELIDVITAPFGIPVPEITSPTRSLDTSNPVIVDEF